MTEVAGGLDRWWRARSGRSRDRIIVGFYALLAGIFFAPFLFSDRMLFGTDIIPMGYSARKIYADYLRTHHAMPLWNPYILGGLPFAEALHGDIFYPASLLYFFFSVHRAIGMKLVLHVFIAGAAMYSYLRAVGLRRAASTVGGAAYMFAPYLVSLIYAGHDAKMYVTALFPFLLAALERIAAGRGVRAAVEGGAVVGLMLLSSHVQMAYFALWGAALYTIGLLIREHRQHHSTARLGRLAALAALAVVIGLAVGMVQLLPPYLYTKAWSPRAGGVEYDFAASWSLHPEEVVSLVLPEFGGYQESYWGRNPFKLNMESPGTLVMLLGLIGIAGWRRWPAIPAAAIGGFALLYALGAHTPLHHLFYSVVPGVKFFRAPSIIMFLFSWGAAALAALALERLMEEDRPARASRAAKAARARIDWRHPGPREFLYLAGAWWGLFVVAALLRGAGFDSWCSIFYRDITSQARQAMQANVSNVLRGIAVTGVIVALAALAVRSRARMGRAGLALALVLLVFAGDWRIDRPFVKPVQLTDYIVEDALVKTLESDHDLFRVLPATGRGNFDQNYLPIFSIQTANGFHDNRMASYDLLLHTEGGLSYRQLALLNVKYLVTPRPMAENPAFTELMNTQLGYLYRLESVLPRTFLVHHARVMEDPAALKELLDGTMPLDSEIILPRPAEAALADPPAGSPDETVEVMAYDLREVRVRLHASAPGLLYFGDNYYPAWHALVDGTEEPLLRANVSLRAVAVPAGDHEVVFHYHSPVLARSMALSAAASILVVVFLVGEPFLLPATAGERPPRRCGLKSTVVIPTFNERENILSLVDEVLRTDPRLDILVVDDSSPDGTGDLVAELAGREPRVKLLRRKGKLGLGSAYVAGFKQALADGAELILEMDADHSHDPKHLPAMLEAARQADVVLGSRYLQGVNVVNWPLSRLILSYIANAYARHVTGLRVRDLTGGYKCFHRRVLETIDLGRIRSDGYAFQIELTWFAWHHGFTIREVPIIFWERHAGASKLSRRIIWEALWLVWRLRLSPRPRPAGGG